jgi:hypothetical protein
MAPDLPWGATDRCAEFAAPLERFLRAASELRQDQSMEFLSGIVKTLADTWASVEAALAGSPSLAGIGLMLAVGAGLAIAVLALAGLVRLLFAMRRGAVAKGIKKQNEIGARIVVVRGGGGRRSTIAGFLHKSVDTHLKEYMFGGPFAVISYPGSLEGDARAQQLLTRTEADVILWAEAPRGTKGCARILARPTNTFEPPRAAVTLAMPKEKSTWNEALARAMAYAAAKQFRPALGRPQDFRAERLQPVVESVLSILSQKPKADPALLAEMVDDSSAGALQLAFAGDDAWIDKSVEIARSTLGEINRSAAPDRWIAANITLGRALRLKAEKRFDPVMLREGIAHLTEALEALRSEPRLKLAESAAQAIGEAQKLLGTRRKFSISGGGI